MWITVKKAAELLNLTERAVCLNCQRKKYVCRCIDGMGRGGKQYEIDLDSLPEIAKIRYYGVSELKDIINPERPNGCSGKQWSEAEQKARIVTEYKSSGLSVDEFLKWYNENYEPKKPLNRQRLFLYQRKYKSGGVAALIDTRGGVTGGVPLTDEMWEYFYSLYMTQQRRTVKLCYDKTKDKFGEPFPSVSSFERKVRTIDNYSLVRYREGEHALKDLLPSMERDKSSIDSNDIWFSDHHAIDIFVKNAKGKPYRPWLTVFFDARSNKIVSFVVREAAPNAFVIKKCLKIGIESCGIPKEVYFDNGKDYRSKDFDKDFPLSIVNQLGINSIHATPYHGQAKTVERFFGIFEDRFGKLFPTYCGKDNKNRPEQMRISNKKIAKIAPTTEEFENSLSSWINEYNNAPNGGGFMNGESPNTVFAKNLKIKVKVNKDALDMMFSTVNIRTVHKNGVSVWNNNYYDTRLIPYFQQKVLVRNSPDNIDKVFIFDMENNYICTAAAKVVTAYRNTSEADYAEAARQKRAVQEHVKKYEPKRNLSVHELIAQNQAEEYSLKTDASEVEYVVPQAQTAALALKENSDKPQDKSNLSKIMNEYYKKKKQA